MIRQPAVAGSFYPASPDELSSQLDDFIPAGQDPRNVSGLIVPHAGYIYSGKVAGEVFASAKIPREVVLLGPNHHGLGDNIAVSGVDAWSTPLGQVPVAVSLRNQLVNSIPELSVDDRAHEYEHSLEVMLPFLLQRQPELRIVPISLGQLSLAACLKLGTALAKEIKSRQEEVLLLASSDMNHFSDAENNEKLDSLAIDAMTAYDPQRLYLVVRDNRISMCGVLPAVIVMQAAHELGARKCRLIRYAHSGQVNGDNSRVVGYAGLTLE
ncbi:AmmeMemoRadiSam system protein B [uncultured Desulfuromusa sp.]|uniref:AmmeMemoRadiSam system protein B n=1 Tax=uncultured Desulfuromusa sp. TaxID=219183 RepID=UPI002AA6EA87|nr:AmmeMemoRadiSam system protein B [uncultured Desulfuromusa sp.]